MCYFRQVINVMQYLYSIPSLLAYTFVIGKSVIMVGQEPRVSMGDCNHEEPSNILQSKHFGESGMSPLFRTLRRRDFSPERILPKSDSDGGNV